jgi:hypothetical protein
MKALFITDNGTPLEITDWDTGALVCVLPRFAIWDVSITLGQHVMETSNNLEKLLIKYNLSDKDVYMLDKKKLMENNNKY